MTEANLNNDEKIIHPILQSFNLSVNTKSRILPFG